MGYESRLYVVERNVHKNKDGEPSWVYGEKIAMFNLCCMGRDWDIDGIFSEPIDFPIEYDAKGNDVYEDLYGQHCGMADIDTVIESLEEFAEHDDYRRIEPVLCLLKGFDKSRWKDLRVVHYGY